MTETVGRFGIGERWATLPRAASEAPRRRLTPRPPALTFPHDRTPRRTPRAPPPHRGDRRAGMDAAGDGRRGAQPLAPPLPQLGGVRRGGAGPRLVAGATGAVAARRLFRCVLRRPGAPRRRGAVGVRRRPGLAPDPARDRHDPLGGAPRGLLPSFRLTVGGGRARLRRIPLGAAALHRGHAELVPALPGDGALLDPLPVA